MAAPSFSQGQYKVVASFFPGLVRNQSADFCAQTSVFSIKPGDIWIGKSEVQAMLPQGLVITLVGVGLLLGVRLGLNGLFYWLNKQASRRAQNSNNIPMVSWQHQEV